MSEKISLDSSGGINIFIANMHTPLDHIFSLLRILDADKAMGCEFHSSIIFVVGFIIEYKIAPIQNDKAAIQPLSVVEALAPEFNFSHISKCFKMFQNV